MRESLSPAELDFIADCDAYVVQVDNRSPTLDDLIPNAALRIAFPLIAMNWLWPFTTRAHPKNQAVTCLEMGPYGRTCGDAILNRLMAKHANLDSVIAEYALIDPTKVTNLDRLFELSREQVISIEQYVDIPMWGMIEAEFRRKRLFYDFGHADWLAFAGVSREVLRRLPLNLSSSQIDAVLHRMGAMCFSDIEAPIHPRVAEHFKLEWYTPGIRFRRGIEGWVTFDEYVRRYLEYRFDLELHDAFCNSRMGQALEASEAVFRDRATSQPENNELAYWLADNLHRQGRCAEALHYAKLAAGDENVGSRAVTHFQTYNILTKLGRFEESAVVLRQALKVARYPARYFYLLGLTLLRIGREEEAIDPLREAVKRDPAMAEAYFYLGRLLCRSGSYGEGCAALLKAERCAPEMAAYVNEAMFWLSKVGRNKEALRLAGRLTKLAPDKPESHRWHAWLLYKSGHPRRALRSARIAAALGQTDAALRLFVENLTRLTQQSKQYPTSSARVRHRVASTQSPSDQLEEAR